MYLVHTLLGICRAGEELAIFDGRPNGEVFLATGDFEDGNPVDCLFFEAGLVRADRLFKVKLQVAEEVGLGQTAEFPVFQDKMPQQLLSYLRLSRIQDAAQLAKVGFQLGFG